MQVHDFLSSFGLNTRRPAPAQGAPSAARWASTHAPQRRASEAHQIEVTEVEFLIANAHREGPAYCICAIVMSIVLMLHVPVAYGLSWGVGCLACVGAHQWLVAAYRRYSPDQLSRRLAFWKRAMTVLMLAFGLVWGSVVMVAFPYSPLEMKFFWSILAFTSIGFVATKVSKVQLYAALAGSMPALALAWWLWGGMAALPVMALIASRLLIYVRIAQQQRKGNTERVALALRNQALAATLEQRNRALDATNRSQSALLAAASHDLRQPVHALGMIVELMNPDDPEALRRRLASVRSCTQTLSDMLTQLLDFNRLDLGLYVPESRPVALEVLLREVHESLGAPAEHKGLALRVQAPPLWVRSDLRLLRRILFNLVTNAIKFTPRGHVSVKCFVRDGTVHVSVSDSGIGIAREWLDEIFVEYARPPSDRMEWQEGLGLGLSIVRKGAILLGHDIAVESTPGRGTRFTLRLGKSLPPPGAGEQDESMAALPPVTVAVIENDAAVLEGLVDTLSTWGCSPVGANGLAQMERRLTRESAAPSLLVSDFHLADADNGLDAIERLRLRFGNPALPAILLTGDMDPALQGRASARNVRLAHKPMRPQALRGLVIEALAHDAA